MKKSITNKNGLFERRIERTCFRCLFIYHSLYHSLRSYTHLVFFNKTLNRRTRKPESVNGSSERQREYSVCSKTDILHVQKHGGRCAMPTFYLPTVAWHSWLERRENPVQLQKVKPGDFCDDAMWCDDEMMWCHRCKQVTLERKGKKKKWKNKKQWIKVFKDIGTN